MEREAGGSDSSRYWIWRLHRKSRPHTSGLVPTLRATHHMPTQGIMVHIYTTVRGGKAGAVPISLRRWLLMIRCLRVGTTIARRRASTARGPGQHRLSSPRVRGTALDEPIGFSYSAEGKHATQATGPKPTEQTRQQPGYGARRKDCWLARWQPETI